MRTMASKQQPAQAKGLKALPTSAFFSDNPDKAWTERMILAQSGFWMSAVGLVMLTGLIHRLQELDLLLFSITVAAPPVLLPLLSSTRPDRDVPWFKCYWAKFNVWIAILVAFGTYFGSHYFFDLMGMRYTFNVRWTFDSHILGHSGQRVPVFMYPLTHAYFATYYTLLVVCERALVRWLQPALFARTLIVCGLSYALAFAETFLMDTELMTGLFSYEKHGRMLSVGSLGYASYFLVGLPMVRRIDEGERWPMTKVIIDALAACMAILVLLEAWAKVMGPL
ncbi:unnamed protein product [Parascedosporium putredinis]|uniref:Cycloeucalenol cycloisomerase n=1 Tax=Parascedosporium putredinis TaxID=1442378 RepID=A0A9P1H1M1_9PEZI|nr:unnamed protein product [Parascedosporium putredinis]CAI7993912.1 unnamed protein product [Parascedosporium putredinis]